MGDQRDVRVDESEKRVRALLGGVVVADTRRPKLVWEHPHYPTYYFPDEAVRSDLLVPTGDRQRSETLGDAEVLDVEIADQRAPGAARRYERSPVAGLDGTVRLSWRAMDRWLEEDEEVHVHPRDPYTRIDVLQSSRHVRVEVDGTTVADSHHPRLLFETGLPVRFYLPPTDVRLDLLEPSDTTTGCPYKGEASYHHVEVDGRAHEDLVWTYRYPTLEAAEIAGHLCFYDERADTYVDGELLDRG